MAYFTKPVNAITGFGASAYKALGQVVTNKNVLYGAAAVGSVGLAKGILDNQRGNVISSKSGYCDHKELFFLWQK